MNDLSDARMMSSSAMQAQAMRLRHIAENIANADTPGFRRKIVDFRQEHGLSGRVGTVETGPIRLDRRALPMIYDPGHKLADDTGHFAGSNVDLVIELADARQAQRSYEANLRMFDQARQMSQSLRDLLRR